MDRLAFCASERGPALWLLNLDTGQVAPVPTALSRRSAFDHGLGRRGWVAVQVGYEVAAFVDGDDPSTPVLLPQAWRMWPALTDDLVLLTPFFGRSGFDGEKQSVLVAGADGTVHRSVVLPWDVEFGQIAGEVDAGVVTASGIGGWDGSITPLPVTMSGDPFTDPRPFAVLAGQIIVFEGVDYIEAVDVHTGGVRRLEVPPMPRRWPSSHRHMRVRCNADATWLEATNEHGSVIAGLTGQLRWLPREPEHGPWGSTLWVGDDLLIHDYGPTPYDEGNDRFVLTESAYYDPLADRFTLTPAFDTDLVPRVDVTGRVDFATALKAAADIAAAPPRPPVPWQPDDLSWLPGAYEVVEFAGGASEAAIARAEAEIGPFPAGYRNFLARYGAARLGDCEVFGIGDGSSRWSDVVEETRREREEVFKELPANLIAVLGDGFGNNYCVESPADAPNEAVYVWWHDDKSDAELVAETFEAWLRTLPPTDT
jgi:hypothetical protein